MKELVYPREKTLGTLTLVLGLLIWVCLIVGTFGVALIMLLVGFVLYLFAQSTLISHIKGNGVELSPEQFPDLHAQFGECCERLGMERRPQAFVMNGDGGLNAFATQFLGTQFVVLLSDVVDAMDKHPDGVRFYIGHELGHLRMKHLSGHLLRWPALWLPLLGAAYSRARESTCDRHGLACCSTPEAAVQAIAALASGPARWAQLDIRAYLRQAQHSSGFWMSFHELTAGYPWLTKRAARVMNLQAKMPPRHGLAYVLAAFIPYAGRLGAGFGVLMLAYAVGVIAAVALPAYHDYQGRAHVSMALANTQPTLDALAQHYQRTQEVPATLEEAGIPSQLADGTLLELNADDMVLTATLKEGPLVFTPTVDDQGKVSWQCSHGDGLRPALLPPQCRADDAPGN